MKSVEERLRTYEPLWENWTYTGEFLGEGAMSSVFEIQSTAMGLREIAALKIITVKKGPDGEVRIPESTLNEIKILRTLSGCPNIVRYHDSTQRKIFDENDTLSEIDILIKMEKLEPLSEGKKLSEEEVTKLARDMCHALIEASAAGIIHRDIKPQNIFVSNDGTYKLGDFGIAKIISDLSHHYTTNIGTLAYTAPEVQNIKSGSYDISSDIYSLGLVLYVFLNNGYLPFANSTSSVYDAVMKRLSGAPFPSPANGSAKLKSIVMRACNADTVKRYRTPKEMLEDLELLSTGGKKLVLDPFATLDANLEEIVSEYSSAYGSSVPPSHVHAAVTETPSPTGRKGLKIRMNKTQPSSGDDVSATKAFDKKDISHVEKSGLKINMRTTAGKSSGGESEMKTRVATPEEKSVVKSGLKINMKSTSVASSDSTAEMKTRASGISAEKSVTGSGLKINLKSTPINPPDSESTMKTRLTDKVSTKPAEEETKADEDKDSFFFAPPSL